MTSGVAPPEKPRRLLAVEALPYPDGEVAEAICTLLTRGLIRAVPPS